LIPLRIREYGYTPYDDAHRHIGKAISDKPWDEILVMREDVTIDTNFGWHKILGVLHTTLTWDADNLMTFSIVSLFLIVVCIGLLFFRWPESWLGALLVLQIPYSYFIGRLTQGRPYILSMAILIVLLMIWRPTRERMRSWSTLLATTFLISCATWIHGSWYLWGLVVGAFLFAGRIKDTVYLGICWICGSIIGACLTGNPVNFLWEQLRWAFDAFGRHEVQRMLVTEFQPTDGVPVIILIMSVFIIWIRIREGGFERIFREPVFILVLIGWVFGLATKRFWLDWGMPAMVLFIAIELQHVFTKYVLQSSLRRLGIACFVSLALYLSTTSDLEGRWTSGLMNKYLDADDPELSGWMPDENGILYSADMGDFYRTFYTNPHAKWRYVLGYEPAIMKEEDLQIYRDIQWNYGIADSYMPWVEKMTSSDRLLIEGYSKNTPDIPALEWKFAGGLRWIGRLPGDNNMVYEGSVE
jgi:hypothetical protein